MEEVTDDDPLKSAARELYEALSDVRLILVVLIAHPPPETVIRLDDLKRFQFRVDTALAKARGAT
jgi:hypothetical protein